jgi:8-oxo-dGTP pyrophosphatase MutT (NUDIX family)/HD superfamily phosphodiesterase
MPVVPVIILPTIQLFQGQHELNGSEIIAKTETYVKEVMSRQSPELAVGHGFKHVDRVRNWALAYGRLEGYPDLTVLEVTALLHDIGLGYITGAEAQKSHVVLPPHGPLGAEMAAVFLKKNSGFDAGTIELIADAIRHNSDPPYAALAYIDKQKDQAAIFKILCDADMTDAMGAVGLVRALTSKSFLPEYDPADVKGPAWGLSTDEFIKQFSTEPGRERLTVKTIIDQINQQIRYYDSLHTRTARDIAAPLAAFMKAFVIKLEQEVGLPQRLFRREIRYQGAVIRDGHVLLVNHLQQHSGRTFWALPGGGIEPGETEKDCIRRELKEETCLNVKVVSLLLDQERLPDDNSIYRRRKTFRCEIIDGTPAPGSEPDSYNYSITEVAWFDLRNPDTWNPAVKSDPKTVRILDDIKHNLGYNRT